MRSSGVLKLTDHHGACLHTGIIDIDVYNGKLWVDDAGIWVDVKGKYGNIIRDGKLPVFEARMTPNARVLFSHTIARGGTGCVSISEVTE